MCINIIVFVLQLTRHNNLSSGHCPMELLVLFSDPCCVHHFDSYHEWAAATLSPVEPQVPLDIDRNNSSRPSVHQFAHVLRSMPILYPEAGGELRIFTVASRGLMIGWLVSTH